MHLVGSNQSIGHLNALHEDYERQTTTIVNNSFHIFNSDDYFKDRHFEDHLQYAIFN